MNALTTAASILGLAFAVSAVLAGYASIRRLTKEARASERYSRELNEPKPEHGPQRPPVMH
jgi:hypothetical protein